MATKDKGVRYDRQVRLWGQDGQGSIEKARILCVGAGPTASETLKNLVLPGVGHITIVDNVLVEQRDLGNNFFVEDTDIGKSRAEAVSVHLNELNPFVECAYVHDSIKDLLSNDNVSADEENNGFFSGFTLIICAQQDPITVQAVSDGLRRYNSHIPLFLARSIGLVGIIRIEMSEHIIVDSMSEHTKEDLRINNPWLELKELCMSVPESSLRGEKQVDEHAHIPFPHILIQAIEKYRARHDNKDPKTDKEKDEFKAIIKKMSKGEPNFDEALSMAYHAFMPYSISSELRSLFDAPQCVSLRPMEDCPSQRHYMFWVIIRAIKSFHDRHGVAPLRGSLPDLTASTSGYQELQRCYKNKADLDSEEVYKLCQEFSEQTGDRVEIPMEMVQAFCRNSHKLRSVIGRTLQEEQDNMGAGDLSVIFMCDDHNVTAWYIVFQAADAFYNKHHRFPGQGDQDVCNDIPLLKEFVLDVVKNVSDLSPDCVPDEKIHEMCRYGTSEIHSTAAFVGGVVSQEVLKILTCKWEPINNTFIYDGIKSACTSFRA